MPESAPPSGIGAGQLAVLDTKHMPAAVSQQLDAAPAGGQVFWQSRSVVQVGAHTGPGSTLPLELLTLVVAAADAPPALSNSSVSLPDAHAATIPEGRRTRARIVRLALFTALW